MYALGSQSRRAGGGGRTNDPHTEPYHEIFTSWVIFELVCFVKLKTKFPSTSIRFVQRSIRDDFARLVFTVVVTSIIYYSCRIYCSMRLSVNVDEKKWCYCTLMRRSGVTVARILVVG